MPAKQAKILISYVLDCTVEYNIQVENKHIIVTN